MQAGLSGPSAPPLQFEPIRRACAERSSLRWPLNFTGFPRDDTIVKETADVAQLVEQLIRNQQVIGSSPIVGSSLFGRISIRSSKHIAGKTARALARHPQLSVAICDAERTCHLPRVKSGNFCGALPAASEARLNGPGADQAAASYTSRSGTSPLRMHSSNL